MEAFAYQNKLENVIGASSGGTFQRLAETIVKDSACDSIYGAVWTDDFDVEHRRTDDIHKIGMFSGSKYLRSHFTKMLPLLRDDLKRGTLVIFSGTPCMIASVLKFVEKEELPQGNLYTIEIICHGTPERRVWQDCRLWTENKFHSKIKQVSFRDKRVGWKYYPTRYAFENEKEIQATYEAQLYIRLFMSSMITSKGCFSCPYSSNIKRNADITIGDFWGIEDIMPDFLIQKGEQIRECTNDNFLKYQHNLNRPTVKPEKYEELWIDYNKYGFDYVIKKYEFYAMYKKSRYLARKFLDRVKGII